MTASFDRPSAQAKRRTIVDPLNRFLETTVTVYKEQIGGVNPNGKPPPPFDENLIEKHRLSALFHASDWVKAASEEQSDQPRRRILGQLHNQASLTEEATRIAQVIGPEVIFLGLVKGPGLAEQAWPNPALRLFDDLDFRCSRNDGALLTPHMRALNYKPEVLNPRRRQLLWHYGWGMSFRNDRGHHVEFNHRFFPPFFPCPLTLEASIPRYWEPWPSEDSSLRIPTPGLHLLYGSLHGAWHAWERLAWWIDMAGLVRRHPEAESQAHSLADSSDFARNSLKQGLQCGRTFNPHEQIEPSRCSGQGHELLRRLHKHTPTGSPARSLLRFHLHNMSRSEQLRYLMLRLFMPGDGDFKCLSLPSRLRGFYWILRPIRVALQLPVKLLRHCGPS